MNIPKLFILPSPRAYVVRPCTCSLEVYCGPCQEERDMLDRLVNIKNVKH